MDYSRFSKLKLCTLLVAMVAVTACSSSKVEDGQDTPPETVSDLSSAPNPDAAAANTDPVPAPAPDANAATASNGQPAATDPALDAAMNTPQDAPAPGALDSSPVADAPNAAAAASDPMASGVAPITDAPGSMPAIDVAAAPVTDAGAMATDPMATDPAPVDVAAMTPSDSADAKPKKGKKGKKHHKGTTHYASAKGTGMSGDGVHYSVKQGDTLMKIAFENYGDLYRWKEIYEANRDKIQDPNHVPPGTQLTLNGAGMVQIERNGERYMIKHGDTLGTISKDVYGSTRKWKKLWENNRQLIKDPNKIYAGFYLYYQPEGRMANEHNDAAPTAAVNTQSGVSPGVQAAMKNAPTQPVGNVAQNTATQPNAMPQNAQQMQNNTAPANNGARAPASVK